MFEFTKGHGTENDFILVDDSASQWREHLTGVTAAEVVRRLADRRAGIGADGVIRVVRTAEADEPDVVAQAHEAEWFMDYRNSDGSLSEMCGNGVRVFAAYLAQRGWVDRTPGRWVSVATRAGVRRVRFEPDGEVTVDMGRPQDLGATQVGVGARQWPAHAVSMGNPHAVAFVADLVEAGDLTEAPDYDRGLFPDGVNVEFAHRVGPEYVAMRVFERGSGETRSCGTGACAVMVTAARLDHAEPGTPYQIEVPGGLLTIAQQDDGSVWMTGPAILVAKGTLLTVAG